MDFCSSNYFDQAFKPKDLPIIEEVFGYYVHNPKCYGVVDFDDNGKVLNLEKKAANPTSNYAVAGLHYFDNKVVSRAKSLKPSDRGELEITDLNKIYLEGIYENNMFITSDTVIDSLHWVIINDKTESKY